MGGIQKAIEWQALIGKNGITNRADLARYLGVSRARVTAVLKQPDDRRRSVTIVR